jgi:hypothetical protein
VVIWLPGDRDDAVAGHDSAYLGDVGIAFGLNNGGEVAEVLGADEAGGEEAHHSGCGGVEVGVRVYGAAGDAQLLAGVNLELLPLDVPGCDAVHAEDGLVVVAMQVGHAEEGVGRNNQLEEIKGTIGFMTAFEEGDADFADLNGMMHGVLPFGVENKTTLCETPMNRVSCEGDAVCFVDASQGRAMA